ncbi:MAG: CDP-alcohol phosphatidyltransferase family protein, partial [Candidatus Zixiibacteriota bacterium]
MFNSAQKATDGGRRDFKGFFPGVFTMGNLVCGFISVLSVSEGDILTGCWFIMLAAFLDLLDGKVARLADANTRFGVELDSLADFMSFGVAPAFLIHSVKLGH